MAPTDYIERKHRLEAYFDRTAAENWRRLTSDAPVGRVRATVRAGRDEMREGLLAWLPTIMDGTRLLDAGCGTGALAQIVAARGGHVVAADVSPTLIDIARERIPSIDHERVTFHVGDMLDDSLGEFDYVVAMDSMIHYGCEHLVNMLASYAPRTRRAIIFTFAPRTVALSIMHRVGRLIPNLQHRAPAIEPIAERRLREAIRHEPALKDWRIDDINPVSRGFYTSTGMRLVRS
ncbi:MAG: magnesium protoporphyrin IX methyltransferase [Pseudomonadota bacterium]